MGNACACRCCCKCKKETYKYMVSQEVIDHMKQFELPHATVQSVSHALGAEIDKGRNAARQNESSFTCQPSFITQLPTGLESGTYLGLVLEGSSFYLVLLDAYDGHFEVKKSMHPVPNTIKTGVQLFDHIAECTYALLKVNNLENMDISLAITVCFACKQSALNSAVLLEYSKDFYLDGMIGEDLAELAQSAFKRIEVQARCVAVLSESVACLMAGARRDRKCLIGVILGESTSACYVEDLTDGGTLDLDQELPKSRMVINTEWSKFGDRGGLDFIKTRHDEDIDSVTPRPGENVFEKLAGGLYLGEIVRLCLVALIRSGRLFNGLLSRQIMEPRSFSTTYMAYIENDTIHDNFKHTRRIMAEVGYEEIRRQDIINLQYVCAVVLTRSACLVAAGIATLMNRVNSSQITVVVEGGLVRLHPTMQILITEKLRQLVSREKRFRLLLVDDAKGKGAALTAAISANPDPS